MKIPDSNSEMEFQNDAMAKSVLGRASGTRIMIRTDLYAAIRHENRMMNYQKAARQSPGLMVAGMIALLFCTGAIHYFYLLHGVQSLRPQADELVAKADFLHRELENANSRIQAQREKVARRTALMKFAENRINWAPVLEGVLATTPSQVELVSVLCTSLSQQKATLTVSGRTATKTARLDCDKFRLLMIEAFKDAGITAEGKFTRLEEVEAKTTGAPYLNTEFAIQLSWTNTPHGK